MKNGAKWERTDKLMIKGDFVPSRSPVRPGLPDLSNLSLSREAGRLIQLRLAESEKWHGLVLISGVFPLISRWRWPGHRGVQPRRGPGGGEAGFRSGVWGPPCWCGEAASAWYFLPRSLSRVLLGGDFLLISSFLGRRGMEVGGTLRCGGHRRPHLLEANECHWRSH